MQQRQQIKGIGVEVIHDEDAGKLERSHDGELVCEVSYVRNKKDER
jgi:hypothetical protein